MVDPQHNDLQPPGDGVNAGVVLNVLHNDHNSLNLFQAAGRDRVEIVSGDRRIQMETTDLNDFVVYSVDPSQFLKVGQLHSCMPSLRGHLFPPDDASMKLGAIDPLMLLCLDVDLEVESYSLRRT